MGGSPFIPYDNSKIGAQDAIPSPESTTPEPAEFKRKWTNRTDITYVGGHPAYPKSGDTRIYIYDNRIEVGQTEDDPLLVIPYANMINIENMDEKKISALRVVGLGLIFVPLAIVGAVWKKKHIYTVIHYNDEVGVQTIVLDFDRFIDKLQPFIYRKMLEVRKK